MATVLLLAAATLSSSAMAHFKLMGRKLSTQCTDAGVGFGTVDMMSYVLNGCSPMGKVDCTAGKAWLNETMGLASCADLSGTTSVNITNKCDANNVTLSTCITIEGGNAFDLTIYMGSACNGSATALGVFMQDACTFVGVGKYAKYFVNSTGTFLGTYSASGCAASSQNFISKMGISGGDTGCFPATMDGEYNSVAYKFLAGHHSSPTAPPTSNSTNGTNGTTSSAGRLNLAGVTVGLAAAVAGVLAF